MSEPLKVVTKDWGSEEWVVNQPNYCAKYLRIDPGKRCSEHYHPIKSESFRVELGEVVVSINGARKLYEPLDVIHIPAGTRHWFGVPRNALSHALLLEVSTHHDDNDVVRLRPSGEFEGHEI